jgi:hypothetical protein
MSRKVLSAVPIVLAAGWTKRVACDPSCRSRCWGRPFSDFSALAAPASWWCRGRPVLWPQKSTLTATRPRQRNCSATPSTRRRPEARGPNCPFLCCRWPRGGHDGTPGPTSVVESIVATPIPCGLGEAADNGPCWARRSDQDVLHHFAVHIGQTEIAALEAIGQPGVIEAEEMEDRRLEVVHVDLVFHHPESELIGLPVAEAAAYATAREEEGERVGK